MNCLQCNAPLEDQARFCRNCGSPVAINSLTLPARSDNSPTVPTPLGMPVQQPHYPPQEQWQAPLTLPSAPQWNSAVPSPPATPPPHYAPQAQPVPPQYMPPVAAQPGSMPGMGMPPAAPSPAHRKRRWPQRLLITLVILIVLLAGGWIFVGRPILHSVAQNQFDQLIGSQVNRLPPLPPQISSTLTITEIGLNNLLTLSIAPSSPVQNAVAHITPSGMELDFQLFGFGCSIKGVPIASNGVVVMTQLQVNGILGLVMSSDEMTTLLNGYIRNAFSNLHRQATSLTLKNQELDIQLSSQFL